MNETVKNALILFAITLIAGALLGATYAITKEPIAQQQIIQRDKALNAVISDATFAELDLNVNDYPKIQSVFEAKMGDEVAGYAFKLMTKEGYGGEIQLVVGISNDGEVTGIDIIKHSETPGLGAKADEDEFKSNFEGKPTTTLSVVKGNATSDDEIVAIGGATITSSAVTGAVNEAIDFYNNELAKEGN